MNVQKREDRAVGRSGWMTRDDADSSECAVCAEQVLLMSPVSCFMHDCALSLDIISRRHHLTLSSAAATRLSRELSYSLAKLPVVLA